MHIQELDQGFDDCASTSEVDTNESTAGSRVFVGDREQRVRRFFPLSTRLNDDVAAPLAFDPTVDFLTRPRVSESNDFNHLVSFHFCRNKTKFEFILLFSK